MDDHKDQVMRISQKKTPLADLFINLSIIVAVASVCAAAVVFWILPLAGNSASQSFNVVMVDTEVLAREQVLLLTEKAKSKLIEPDDIVVKSREFAERLDALCVEYAGKGYLVLRKAAVMSAPSGIEDVTSSIRRSLKSEGFYEDAQ